MSQTTAMVPTEGTQTQAVTRFSGDTSFLMYQGASTHTFADHVRGILEESPDPDKIEVRPDGLVYIPQTIYRRLLNRAFGPGKWALLQHAVQVDDVNLYYDGALFIEGKFVSRAMGEAKLITENKNMTWATVYESAKSDCLTRVCKDLGIFGELWEPGYVDAWLDQYALKVWRKNYPSNGKNTAYWRRKDRKPFWWEQKQNEQQEQGNDIDQRPPEERGGKVTTVPTKASDPPFEDYKDKTADYPIVFGKYAGKTLKDLETAELDKYAKWLKDKNIHPELVKAIDAHITGLPF